MLEIAEVKYFAESGFTHLREFPGGIHGIQRRIFHVSLCTFLDPDPGFLYYGDYSYPTMEEAIVALLSWDGKSDPPGNWIKYKSPEGERRNLKRELNQGKHHISKASLAMR